MGAIVHFIDGLNGVQFMTLGSLLVGFGIPALVHLYDGVFRPLIARFRPPAGPESARAVVTAPRAVIQWRGTPNHLAWLEVSLFLQGPAPCPRTEVIGPRSCG
jgi:hypothetical protein